MPAQTALFDLPYPEDADPADGPDGFKDLADQLELVLKRSDLLFTSGDFKASARTADHGLWLLCDGRQLTAAEIVTALGLSSGDADAFATLLGTGGSSVYGSATAGKVRLPDPRGRAALGVGAGSGLTSRARGAVGGAEEVTLTGHESGVEQHSHGFTDPGHDHAIGNSHQHSISYDRHTNLQAGGSLEAVKEVFNNDTGGSLHRTTGTGGVSGNSSDDPTGISIGNTGPYDAIDGHANMQPWIALGSVFIRV